MKKILIALLLAGFAQGAAAAAVDMSAPDDNSALMLSYRFDWGASQPVAHGLRLALSDRPRAPALFDGRLQGGVTRVTLYGVDLSRDPMLAQTSGSFLGRLTGGQWIVIGVSIVGLAAIVAGSAGGGDDSGPPQVSGTGGG
jgi:hypothetical protein